MYQIMPKALLEDGTGMGVSPSSPSKTTTNGGGAAQAAGEKGGGKGAFSLPCLLRGTAFGCLEREEVEEGRPKKETRTLSSKSPSSPTVLERQPSCRRYRTDSDEFHDAVSEIADDPGQGSRQVTESSVAMDAAVSLIYMMDPKIRELSSLFPSSPVPELARFLAARQGNVEAATEMYRRSKSWRDEMIVSGRMATALEKVSPTGFFRECGRAKDGTKILFVQGARYDPNAATSEEYALATAAMLEKLLPAQSEEKLSVLIDCRANKAAGWPSLPAYNVVPFLRLAAPVLMDNYPERLVKCVVYPVPWLAASLWGVVRGFLDSGTASKVSIGSGSDSWDAPLPKEELAKVFSHGELLHEDLKLSHRTML